MTPYDKLKSLTAEENYLRPGVTLEKLSDIANQISDNEFAERMVKARSNLFDYITCRVNEMPQATFPLHPHPNISKTKNVAGIKERLPSLQAHSSIRNDYKGI